jgi:hypothetical protein
LPAFFTAKIFGMNWTFGEMNGDTIGRPGVRYCRIIWARDFNLPLQQFAPLFAKRQT